MMKCRHYEAFAKIWPWTMLDATSRIVTLADEQGHTRFEDVHAAAEAELNIDASSIV